MTKNEAIEALVSNHDIENKEEFNNILTEDKEFVIKDLEWRISGGMMKGENIANCDYYIKACEFLLSRIKPSQRL